MPDISEDQAALKRLLRDATRIAVVGASPKPDRDSHVIAKYLIEAGYDVIPVNPGQDEILGRRCYPDLKSVPGIVDIVDVFRRPEHMGAVVDEAIAAKAKSVWMQLDTGDAEAARRAVDAGMDVVVEKCIKVVHSVLRVGGKS